MGGNALKNTETRRVDRKDYDEICTYVRSRLSAHPTFAGRRIRDIIAYEQKDSFGDLDLLMESDGLPSSAWDDLKLLFSPNEIVRNGSVTSFDVQGLQVDLLLQSRNTFDTAFSYFAFNDLGNLMGRVAYKLGFKYGHDGLWKLVRSGTGDIIEEISLSKDYRAIFNFLGYDASRWDKGFSTLDDIYEYAASTPYFNAEFYNLATRSHAARVRDKKRPTYMGFLKWLDTKKDLPSYDPLANKLLIEVRAESFFPGLLAQIDAAIDKHTRHLENKKCFNGKVVAAITGLSGDKLGQWIQGFKHQWEGDDAFILWIENTSSSDIQNKIKLDFDNNAIVLTNKVVPIYCRDNIKKWTGLTGASLGSCMTKFKDNWPNRESFNSWLTQQNAESLEIEVRQWVSKNYNSDASL